MTDDSLTHVDASGKLKMVDVSAKDVTLRVARASCVVIARFARDVGTTQVNGLDVIQAARLAGIQAAKSTSDLIPLCHPLGLDDVQVDVRAHERGWEIHSSVSTVSRTGVEMEALVACAFCALSLLDALTIVDPSARLADLAVLSKSGGKSDWSRDVEANA